jgi:hypothetical protein
MEIKVKIKRNILLKTIMALGVVSGSAFVYQQSTLSKKNLSYIERLENTHRIMIAEISAFGCSAFNAQYDNNIQLDSFQEHKKYEVDIKRAEEIREYFEKSKIGKKIAQLDEECLKEKYPSKGDFLLSDNGNTEQENMAQAQHALIWRQLADNKPNPLTALLNNGMVKEGSAVAENYSRKSEELQQQIDNGNNVQQNDPNVVAMDRQGNEDPRAMNDYNRQGQNRGANHAGPAASSGVLSKVSGKLYAVDEFLGRLISVKAKIEQLKGDIRNNKALEFNGVSIVPGQATMVNRAGNPASGIVMSPNVVLKQVLVEQAYRWYFVNSRSLLDKAEAKSDMIGQAKKTWGSWFGSFFSNISYKACGSACVRPTDPIPTGHYGNMTLQIIGQPWTISTANDTIDSLMFPGIYPSAVSILMTGESKILGPVVDLKAIQIKNATHTPKALGNIALPLEGNRKSVTINQLLEHGKSIKNLTRGAQKFVKLAVESHPDYNGNNLKQMLETEGEVYRGQVDLYTPIRMESIFANKEFGMMITYTADGSIGVIPSLGVQPNNILKINHHSVANAQYDGDFDKLEDGDVLEFLGDLAEDDIRDLGNEDFGLDLEEEFGSEQEVDDFFGGM